MFSDTHTAEQSATAEIMANMELFGARPPEGEEDPRPLPDAHESAAAITEIFDILGALFQDTCLEADAPDAMWSAVNVFQRMMEKTDRAFDDIAFDIRRALREQDGTEIKSVELERLETRGKAASRARDAFEQMRDAAADLFSAHTGQAWLPATGSKASREKITAAVIDSRDFLAAAERKKTLSLAPEGPKIVVTGGMDYADHAKVWDALDKSRAKHPDMVLIHGGAPKGVDAIAARWAASRKTPQVVFKPDWNRHGKSRAGFVRNDQMLEQLPIGVLVFPGTGLTENLVDKARALGIPAKKFD